MSDADLLHLRIQADGFGAALFDGLFRHTERLDLPPPPQHWNEMSTFTRGHLWRPAIYDMMFTMKVPPMIDPNEGFKTYQVKGKPRGTLSNLHMRPYIPGEGDNKRLIARQEPRPGDWLVWVDDKRALLLPREVFDLLFEPSPP